MARTWGGHNRVAPGLCARNWLLEVERLEHRLTLSAAPVWPVDTALVWNAARVADAPVQFIALPANVEAPRGIRFGAETSVDFSDVPALNLTWRRESLGERPWTHVGEPAVESIAQSPPSASPIVVSVGWFDFEHFGEPSSIIVNKLTPDHLDAIDGIRILPAPHEGGFTPGEIVRTLPAFDGNDWKPGDGHWVEPGFVGRVPLPAFVSVHSSDSPREAAAASPSARVVAGESLAAPHVAAATGSLESSPFAFAAAGAVLGKIGATPWMLPQIEVAETAGRLNAAGASADASSTVPGSGATRIVPAVASTVFELAANVESAIAALADAGPRADLLASVDLGTAALDQALESVMNEVEHLGADLFSWADEAGIGSVARSAAALAAVGIGGAIAWRWWIKRTLDEQDDSESTTWLFHQLQSTTGAA